MRKNLFLLVLICHLLLSCYTAEHDYKKFKTGKFKFEYKVNGSNKVTFFERNDSIEIETYEGKTDSSRIRWVNDNEYVLQKINPKNYLEKKAISIKILTTSKNSYTFEFGLVGNDKKQRGLVEKISN
jgi:hypothetical protein